MNMKHFKDFLEEGASLANYNKHKVEVTASKNGGPKERIHVKVMANSQREAKGTARAHLHKKGYQTHSAIHHGIDYDWLKKESIDMCNVCGQTPCNCTHVDVSEEVEQIEELSNELLDRYKKKAGEAASAADKAKDFEKGHKRFKGIVKATFKQFANDAKK